MAGSFGAGWDDASWTEPNVGNFNPGNMVHDLGGIGRDWITSDDHDHGIGRRGALEGCAGQIWRGESDAAWEMAQRAASRRCDRSALSSSRTPPPSTPVFTPPPSPFEPPPPSQPATPTTPPPAAAPAPVPLPLPALMLLTAVVALPLIKR